MDNRLKNIISVSIILSFSICFLSCGVKNDNIKIGAVIPLSGAASHLVDVRDAMLMAINETNSLGGINGRMLELIVEDSHSDPEQAKVVFEKIEKEYQPLFYVSCLSSVSVALAPFADKYKVIITGIAVTAPSYTKMNEYVYRYYQTAVNETATIFLIIKKLKIKVLGVIYLNDEYGRSVFTLIRDEFEKNNDTLFARAFETDSTDFKTQIEALKDTEAIYVIGFVEQVRELIRQLYKNNYKGHIISVSAGAHPTTITMPEADAVYLAVPIIYNSNFSLAKELSQKFENQYKKPINHQAAVGYELIKLITGILENNEISRKNIKKLFEKGFMYPGLFGNIDLKPGEQDIPVPLYPAQIIDGEIKYW